MQRCANLEIPQQQDISQCRGRERRKENIKRTTFERITRHVFDYAIPDPKDPCNMTDDGPYSFSIKDF